MKARWFAVLLVLPPLCDAARAADPAWYSIVTDKGATIGYASRETTEGPDGRQIVDSQTIALVLEENPLVSQLELGPYTTLQTRRTVRKEDREGRTVFVETTMRNGRHTARDTARIAGGMAEIVHETQVETRHMSVALPPGVRFDEGDGLLADWNRQTPLAFDNFDVDAMAVEHIVIAPAAGPAPAGTTAALRERFDGTTLLAVSRLAIDAKGHIVEAGAPMSGTGMVIRASDRKSALNSYEPYRMLPATMTKSPYLISGSAMRGHIRYRFAFRDGIEFQLPQTSEQRATAAPGGVTLDICGDCGPGLPTDTPFLEAALKPTAWVQSDDPRFRDMAAPIAALPISDARKMEMLLDKARPHLGTVDFNGYYSALEALERRSGDCTEAALMLAALGRAAGIPTMVADGLVYSRESYHGVSNTFMPHSWTLAFVDGKWKSFDLALDKFDATHIALTVGNGDERFMTGAVQLAGLIRWDQMAEVREPPAN